MPAPYPDHQQQESTTSTRVTAKRLTELLAKHLGCTPSVLKAIAAGEFTECGIVVAVNWPTGGCAYMTDDDGLERYRQCVRDVARFGRDAVRDAEDRERKQRLVLTPPDEQPDAAAP